MDLSAREIHDKQFHDAWRGYDQEEVDDFLDRLAEVLDEVQRENDDLHRRTHELEQAVATSRDTESMLKKTLVSAQQAAEEAVGTARDKADKLIAEAQERVQRVEAEARQRTAEAEADAKRKTLEADRAHVLKKRELDASIATLQSFESDLRKRLAAFLESQTRALETLRELPDQAPRASAPARRPNGSPPKSLSGSSAAGRGGSGKAVTLPGERAEDERAQTRRPGVRLATDEDAVSATRRWARGLFSRDDA